MLDAARSVLEIAIKYEVGVARDLFVRAEKECRGVKVEIGAAVVLVRVPAETDQELRKSRIALRQINFLSLFQTDCHEDSSFFCSAKDAAGCRALPNSRHICAAFGKAQWLPLCQARRPDDAQAGSAANRRERVPCRSVRLPTDSASPILEDPCPSFPARWH